MTKFRNVTRCGRFQNKAARTSRSSPLASQDDSELIRMIVAGRSDCFSVLIDRHLESVKKCLRLYVSTEADLEDLIQEVLLKAWLHLATFRRECNLRSWLIRIGINHARQIYRRNSSKLLFQPLKDFAGIASPVESAQQQLLRTEATRVVRSEVAKLPPKLRDAVILRQFNELGEKEAAELLHATAAAVKARLFRARRRLSTKLEAMNFRPERVKSITAFSRNLHTALETATRGAQDRAMPHRAGISVGR